MSLVSMLILLSCNNNAEYSYALIECENLQNHIVIKIDTLIIDKNEEVLEIENTLLTLQKQSIIFRRAYTITLVNNSKKWELEGNGFSLRDSSGSYFIPKGKGRDLYICFLKQKFPKMTIDSVAGNAEY